MAVGVRTPPTVEAQVVELVRAGKSRREVREVTGLHPRTLTRIVRDHGLDWARLNSGSSGTQEAMSKARGYQSEYQRTRREGVAVELLEQMTQSAKLLVTATDPRQRAALAQSLDAMSRAYVNVTKTDALASDKDQMKSAMSMLDKVLEGAQASPVVEVREGVIEQ